MPDATPLAPLTVDLAALTPEARAALLALLDEPTSWGPPSAPPAPASDVRLAMFRAAFHATPCAIVLLGAEDRRIVEINESFERMLGSRREAVIGRTVLELGLFEPTHHEAVLAELERSGCLHAFDVQLRAADGRRVDCLLSAERLALDGCHYLIAVAQDVSELRLLECQLRHAQRMEGIGRLDGGIAHDFNNLLTAILGYAELLEATLLDDPSCLADLLEIRRATERAGALTAQLLTFARKTVVAPRRVELAAFIRDMGRLLERVLREDVVLTVDIPAGAELDCHLDPTQLEQALLNLAVNARDAMPLGGQLRIALEACVLEREFAAERPPLQAGRYVRIEVTDTGHGIAPEILSRIFEPFFTTRPVGQGTGLGLSVCYGIITQCNGSIEAASVPGQGATFRIFLPAAAAQSQAGREAQIDI